MKILSIFLLLVMPSFCLAQVTSSFDSVVGLDNSFSRNVSNGSLGPIDLDSQFEVYGPGSSKLGWRIGFNLNKTLFKTFHLKLGARVVNGGLKGPERPNGQLLEDIIYSRFDIYFFEFPVALRYEFNHSKFSPFIECGITYNRVAGSKITEVRSETSLEIRFTKLKDLKPHQMAAFISAGINYQFFYSGSVYFQPIYRHYFTPFQETTNYNFYLSNFGFELGFRRLITAD